MSTSISAPLRPRARIGTLSTLAALARAATMAAIQAVRAFGERQRSLMDLADLEDWQLCDLGLTRTQVEVMLRAHGIRRDPAQFYLDRS